MLSLQTDAGRTGGISLPRLEPRPGPCKRLGWLSGTFWGQVLQLRTTARPLPRNAPPRTGAPCRGCAGDVSGNIPSRDLMEAGLDLARRLQDTAPMRRPLAHLALAALIAAPAQAQDAADSPLSGLYACAGLADDAARLACYDEAVGSVRAREASREIVTLDTEAKAEIRRESFGYNLPSLPRLGIEKGKREPQSFTVIRVANPRSGRAMIMMENGQVWKQTDGDRKRFPDAEDGGVTAEIRPASFGSFLMTVSEGGRKRVRGMRVERIR